MKKIIISAITVVLLLCCFVFAACGGVTGTYKFVSLTDEHQTINAGDVREGFEITEDYMTVVINEDGTYSMAMMGEGIIHGTWKLFNDNTYVLTNEDGDDSNITIKDGILTIVDEDVVVKFKKK